MEYKGVIVSTLKELEDLLISDKGFQELLTRLEILPREIEEKKMDAEKLEFEQESKLKELVELVGVVKTLMDPLAIDNLLALTKQLYPNLAGTPEEALHMYEMHKKEIQAKAKEMSLTLYPLLQKVVETCSKLLEESAKVVKKASKGIYSAIKKFFSGNGDVKKGGKKIVKNVSISAILVAFATMILGFAPGSLEFFGIIAGTSTFIGFLTAALHANGKEIKLWGKIKNFFKKIGGIFKRKKK